MQILETRLKQLDTRWQRKVVYCKVLQSRSSFTRSNYTNSPEYPRSHKRMAGVGAQYQLYMYDLHPHTESVRGAGGLFTSCPSFFMTLSLDWCASRQRDSLLGRNPFPFSSTQLPQGSFLIRENEQH